MEQDLQSVAGVGTIRRKLLDEANKLMTRLQEGGANDQQSLRVKAVSLAQRGDVALSYEDLPQALKLYDEAVAIFERLAQADPRNSEWQRDLSVSYERLGDIERAGKDLDEARYAYEKSLAVIQKLISLDSNNASWQKHILISYTKLLGVVDEQTCTADGYLTAAEKVLAWFDQAKAFEGDVQMPRIRAFFREYRAKRGKTACKAGEKDKG